MDNNRFRLLKIILIFGFIAIGRTSAINAQTPIFHPEYWQYTASERIDAIDEVDIEQDGASEFAIVTGSQLQIVRGDSSLLWEEPLRFDSSIAAMTIYSETIAVATETQIAFVNFDGEQIQQVRIPSAVKTLKTLPFADQTSRLLVQFENGGLRLYRELDDLVWDYTPENVLIDADGQIQLFENPATGQLSLVHSYSTDRRFGRVDLLADNGQVRWSQAIDRVATTIQVGQFSAESPPLIAIGNTGGALALWNEQGQPEWKARTLNRPIVDLAFTTWHSDETLLIAATDTGKLVAYDQTGRRVWDKAICERNGRLQLDDIACDNGVAVTIEAIDYPTTQQELVRLNVLIRRDDTQHLLSIDRTHQIVSQYKTQPVRQPMLTDSNGDGVNELIVVDPNIIHLVNG